MTRRTITNLIAQFNTDLPDNNAELITPAMLRSALFDFVQSSVPITALIGGSPFAAVPMVLSTTPMKIPTGIYSVALTGNPLLIEPRLPQNDILCKTTIGRILMQFNITFTAANGTDVGFTLAQNGAPLILRSVQTGRGLANQISAEFSWIFETLAINDFFELFALSLSGTPTIQIYNAALKALLLPQYT
jgi:hypothetical protein